GYLLAAVGGVAAGISGAPGARGVEGVAAMAGEVGHSAENGDGHAATGIGGGRRIKGPGAGALNRLVADADDGRLGRVLHRHLLAAVGGVAAGISGAPGARGVESVAAMTGDRESGV